MKQKLSTFALFLLLITSVKAQYNIRINSPEERDKHGFAVSFGSNSISRSQPLIGDAAYDGNGFYTLSYVYISPFNSWLSVQSGIDISPNKVTIKYDLDPTQDPYSQTGRSVLLSLPIMLRANVGKYFFANAGFLLDGQYPKTNDIIEHQFGIGYAFGAGLKYDFESGYSVFLNPFYRRHTGVVSLGGSNNPQHVTEVGVQVGFVITHQ